MAFRRSLYKTPAQLRAMVEPGLITAAALDAVRALIAPGVTTEELDAAASAVIVARGAESNFQLVRGYRHTTCVSVNDQVVHGIPGARVLAAGDIVSIDAGAQFEGWNGDSAITVVVPGDAAAVDPTVIARRERLSEVTRGSLWAGLAALASARRVGEIGDAVQGFVERAEAADGAEYGILRDYVGHGIGRKMHADPHVAHIGKRGFGLRLKAGMAITVEPMINLGGPAVRQLADGWTIVTADGSLSAQWEHTVVVMRDGFELMTEL